MLKHTFKEQARAAIKNAVSVVSSAALAFALVPAVAAPQPAQAIDYMTVPLTFTDYDTGEAVTELSTAGKYRVTSTSSEFDLRENRYITFSPDMAYDEGPTVMLRPDPNDPVHTGIIEGIYRDAGNKCEWPADNTLPEGGYGAFYGRGKNYRQADVAIVSKGGYGTVASGLSSMDEDEEAILGNGIFMTSVAEGADDSYYDAQQNACTEDDWNTLPTVYAKEHVRIKASFAEDLYSSQGISQSRKPVLKKVVFYKSSETADSVEVRDSDAWPNGVQFADTSKRKVVWSAESGKNLSYRFIESEYDSETYTGIIIDDLDLSGIALADGIYYPMLVIEAKNTYKVFDNSQIYQGAMLHTTCYNPFEYVSEEASAANPPTIITKRLPNGSVARAYKATLKGASGAAEQGEFAWSVPPGSLPAGLDLDAASGKITGTPTETGTFDVTVQLAETVGEETKVTTRDYAITVSSDLAVDEANITCTPEVIYAPGYLRVRIPVNVNMKEAGLKGGSASAHIIYDGAEHTDLHYPTLTEDGHPTNVELTRHATYFEGYLATPSEYDLRETAGVEAPVALKSIEYRVVFSDDGTYVVGDIIEGSHDISDINVGGTLAFSTQEGEGSDAPRWARYDLLRIKMWPVDETGAKVGDTITRKFSYTANPYAMANQLAVKAPSGVYRFTVEGRHSGVWMDALKGAATPAQKVDGLPAGSLAQYEVVLAPGSDAYQMKKQTECTLELNEPPLVTCTANVSAEGMSYWESLNPRDYDVNWYRVDEATQARTLLATGSQVELLTPVENVIVEALPKGDLSAKYAKGESACGVHGEAGSADITLPLKPVITVSGSVSCTNSSGAWVPTNATWGNGWGTIELQKPAESGYFVSEANWIGSTPHFSITDVTPGSKLVYSPPAESACGQVIYEVAQDATGDIANVELKATEAPGKLTFGAISYLPAGLAGLSQAAETQTLALDSNGVRVSVTGSTDEATESVPFHIADGNRLMLEADQDGSYAYLSDCSLAIGVEYTVPGGNGVVVGKTVNIAKGALTQDNNYAAEAGDVVLEAGGHAVVSYTNEDELPFKFVVYAADGTLALDSASRAVAAKSGSCDLPFMTAGTYRLYFVQADFLDSLEKLDADGKVLAPVDSDYGTRTKLEAALDGISADDGGRASFATSAELTIADGKTSALSMRLPTGGSFGPVSRLASTVEMTPSYTDSVTVDVTVRLKEGQQLADAANAQLQISTNQIPEAEANGGTVNVRALTFNGKPTTVDRFAANTVDSYGDLAMRSGGITFKLSGLESAAMRSFPLTCSMVIPRTDYQKLEARVWLIDGNGKRYAVGEFEKRTDEVVLKAQPIVTKSNFNISGHTAGGAQVNVLADGMQVASAKADKHGYFTAGVTLPDDTPNNTTVNLSATARYTVGSGSEARQVTASSATVPVLYDTSMNAVKRVTMYWQFEEGSTELESMVVWEDGTPAAMYKSFYRGWDDNAVIFWTVELENPNADEQVLVKVPRGNGAVLLHAARGLFDSANLTDTSSDNDPSWAQHGLPYLDWAKQNIPANAFISEPHVFAESAPSNVSVIFGEDMVADEEAEPTEIEGVNDAVSDAFSSADESKFAASIDAANANEDATMFFVDSTSADNDGELTVSTGADIAGDVKANSAFSVALKSDEGDSWLPVEFSMNLKNMAENDMRAEVEALVSAAESLPYDGGNGTWQGTDGVARTVTAAISGDMTPGNADDRFLVETAQSGVAGMDSMSYYEDTSGNGVYQRVELDNKRAVRTEYNLSKGQKTVLTMRIGDDAVQAGASLGDSTAVWEAVFDRLGEGLLEADAAYGATLGTGNRLSSPALKKAPSAAGLKSKAKDKLPKPDNAKAWAKDVKKRSQYKKEDRMTCDEARMLKDFLDANRGTCLWYESGNAAGTAGGGNFFDIDQQCTVPILERIGEFVSNITGGAKDGPGGVVGAAGDEVKGAIKNKASEAVFGTKHSKQFEDYLLKLWYMGKAADIVNGTNNGGTGFHVRVDWDKYPMAELVAMLARQEEEKKPKKPNTQAETENYPKGQYDPSGYVYEAVESNRIEGATVRLYTYDSAASGAVFADASEFGIDPNPQTTASDGRYQWFVPEGYWQVRVSKPGYTTVSTGESAAYGLNATKELKVGGATVQAADYWMPVLPVQLDVNIGLVSYDAPTLATQVNDDATKVTVVFSKYMKVDSVKASMFAVNGVQVESIAACNAEPAAADGATELASVFELEVPAGAVTLGRGSNAVVTSFDNDAGAPATSYAGTPAPASVKNRSTVTVESIEAVDLSSASVTTAESTFTYTGSAIRPRLVVKFEGQTLRSGRDYTVSYENNVEISEAATATITGTGAYSGTVSIGFKIGAPNASTLQTELASVQDALDGVVPSDDKGVTDVYGNTLAAGAKWMPSDAYNSLQQAIEQAQEVLSKQTATKSEVAAAVRALAKAISAVYTAEGSQSSEGGEGGSGSGGSGSGSVSGGGTSGGGSTAPAATTVKAGKSYVVGSGAKAAYYKVKKVATKKAAGTVWYAKPKSPKKVKKLSIPATVKIKGLTYNVVGIEAKALSKCTKLTKATIGSKVVTIGKNAFKGAKKLKTLTIGAKVKAVGKTAFKGCKKLKKVTVKSAKLTKTSCKNLVKGTKITKVVLKGSAKKAKVKKKYKKYFPKKNAGKKLKIA